MLCSDVLLFASGTDTSTAPGLVSAGQDLREQQQNGEQNFISELLSTLLVAGVIMSDVVLDRIQGADNVLTPLFNTGLSAHRPFCV